MVLVPEAMLTELKGKLPKSPEFQATLGLGQQLDLLPDRDDLTPEERGAWYGHQLYRYRNYLKQAREQQGIPKSMPAPPAGEGGIAAAAAAAAAPPPAAHPEIETQVIQSVNKPMRKKAGLLLEHLKKTNVLSWDREGKIKYRGQSIPDSNIVDLVSESLRFLPRKRHPPPDGMMEFTQALKETNAPRDYIQNPNVIKAMQRSSGLRTPKRTGEDDDEFHEASFVTPRPSPIGSTPRIKRLERRPRAYPVKRWSKLDR